MIGLTIDNFERIKFYTSIEGLNKLKEGYIKNNYGVVILILLQIIQSIIFILPSEAVEILSGMLYGPYLGMLLCIIGNVIGQIIIYYLVKIFKIKLKKTYKIDNLYVVFVVYLLPFTPKDLFSFIIPMTNINKYKYLIVSNLARIPSILASTLFIDLTMKNNMMGFVLYGIFSLISIMILSMVKENKRVIYEKK